MPLLSNHLDSFLLAPMPVSQSPSAATSAVRHVHTLSLRFLCRTPSGAADGAKFMPDSPQAEKVSGVSRRDPRCGCHSGRSSADDWRRQALIVVRRRHGHRPPRC